MSEMTRDRAYSYYKTSIGSHRLSIEVIMVPKLRNWVTWPRLHQLWAACHPYAAVFRPLCLYQIWSG